MKRRGLDVPDAGALGAYLKANMPDTPPTHAGHGGMSSKRVDSYKGHAIEIETAYSITVDGKTVMVPVHVADSGEVHTHALPNYSWHSTLDLVRQLVDMFPDDFPKPVQKKTKKAQRKTAAGKKTAAKKGT